MSTHFYALRIAEIKRETEATVSISFEIPADQEENFKFIPGQYLTIKVDLNGEDVRRSYSICSTPSEGELRVAVKEVENGTFSTYANRELKTGDTLEVMPPDGSFVVKPDIDGINNHIFYAAGSGITPVLSMVRSILETESDSKVFLYYGNRTAADTIFKSQLDELDQKYANFTLTYVLSREDTGNSETYGRIDEAKCSNFYEKELSDLKITGVYCCGPEEMIEMVKNFYLSKGLLHKVHFELFTTPVATTITTNTGDSAANIDSNVTVIIDEEEYKFELSTDGKSVLQAAQDSGADVPFSCKGGVCCTCKAKIIEGSVKMDVNFALEENEVADGFILTCQSHPTTERLIVSYDDY